VNLLLPPKQQFQSTQRNVECEFVGYNFKMQWKFNYGFLQWDFPFIAMKESSNKH